MSKAIRTHVNDDVVSVSAAELMYKIGWTYTRFSLETYVLNAPSPNEDSRSISEIPTGRPIVTDNICAGRRMPQHRHDMRRSLL